MSEGALLFAAIIVGGFILHFLQAARYRECKRCGAMEEYESPIGWLCPFCDKPMTRPDEGRRS